MGAAVRLLVVLAGPEPYGRRVVAIVNGPTTSRSR